MSIRQADERRKMVVICRDFPAQKYIKMRLRPGLCAAPDLIPGFCVRRGKEGKGGERKEGQMKEVDERHPNKFWETLTPLAMVQVVVGESR